MYKIIIENLEFDAVIGILPHERKKKQKLSICCEAEYENRDSFVDYAKVCNIIEKVTVEGEFLLIEDALEEISLALKVEFPQIKSLRLKIKKPEILRNALVGVEILRKY